MSAAPLIHAARAAAVRAYAPYSGFKVGCAVESDDGRIATGANMENACYPLGVCAEVAALAAAQQLFGLEQIVRIAVAGGRDAPDGTLAGKDPVTPCGGCRQSILEAAQAAGRDIEIICAGAEGGGHSVTSISALLPDAFGLPTSQGWARPG